MQGKSQGRGQSDAQNGFGTDLCTRSYNFYFDLNLLYQIKPPSSNLSLYATRSCGHISHVQRLELRQQCKTMCGASSDSSSSVKGLLGFPKIEGAQVPGVEGHCICPGDLYIRTVSMYCIVYMIHNTYIKQPRFHHKNDYSGTAPRYSEALRGLQFSQRDP